MRALVIGIAVAALLWSGYWVYGSRQTTQTVRDWFAMGPGDGWATQATDVTTRGFPNRFDTTIDRPDLRFADGYGWTAPFVQILRLSYKPEHAILIFPDRQTVTLNGADISVSSERLRASTVFERGGAPTLDRANVAADRIALSLPGIGEVTIASALAAIRKSAARSLAHDIAIELRDVTMPFRDEAPGPRVQAVVLDATARIDAPLNMAAFESLRLGLREIDLRRFEITGDDFAIASSGTLTRSGDGSMSGTLELRLTNWRAGLALAQHFGLISPVLMPGIEAELQRIDGETPGDGDVAAPLDFRRGAVFLNSLRLN